MQKLTNLTFTLTLWPKGQKKPKGRRVGEDHQNAILTNSEVESMRDLREQGKTYEWLADKFEVSKSSVAKICQYNRR